MEPAAKKSGKSSKREKKSHAHKHSEAPDTSASRSSTVMVLAESDENWDANRARVEALCNTYPNNVCNDCNETGTRWAVVNFGVFVCIRCAGVHRSLGTHVSKVKSTNMDKWSACEVDLMEAVGNTRGKAIYEAQMSSTVPLTGGEPDDVVRRFIKRKYADWEFATAKAEKLVRRLQKQVGYGGTKTATTRAAGCNVTSTPSEPASALPAEEVRAKREQMLEGLYGQAALAARKANKSSGEARKAQLMESQNGAAAPTKARTVHGSFGVVNVSPEVYEAHLQTLLTAFGCLPRVVPALRTPTHTEATADTEASQEPIQEEMTV